METRWEPELRDYVLRRWGFLESCRAQWDPSRFRYLDIGPKNSPYALRATSYLAVQHERNSGDRYEFTSFSCSTKANDRRHDMDSTSWREIFNGKEKTGGPSLGSASKLFSHKM